jgi:diguanylate cyclase
MSQTVIRLLSGIAFLREQTESRSVDASGRTAPLISVLWVVTALGLAGVITYLAGGSSTAVPHAFYLPIIVAAVRLGASGALGISLLAGLAMGPLMPLDVAAGTAQSPGNWITRLVIFVAIGQFTAYLVRHSLPSLTSQLSDRRTRREIRDAITQGQMRVEYQPIMDLASGDVVGAEALVRWDHPTRGLIGPDVFVRDAERTGCIGDITRFVLTETCTQVARWRTGVLSGCESFKIAVNLSGADLSDDGLPMFVGDVLAESGLPNSWLHLEVTETALVADIDAAVNSLMALRILGVRLALDDFGTGTSSLAHLHRFPLDVVKIDRVFVARTETHKHSAILTSGIISLAHTMGLTTVAEGIETPGQAQVIRDFGCDFAQGFLFSRPLRPENFETLVADLADIRRQALSRSISDTDCDHWR